MHSIRCSCCRLLSLVIGSRNAVGDGSPSRAHGEGVAMGLTVLLDAQIDDYTLTTAPYYGFKV